MIKNLIILLFFILNLEGKILNLTIKEKEYIKNNPIVLAHNEKNWPPFNFNENGVPLGYSIDYINLLASKVGLNINFISGYSWTEYMQMLQTPKLDLIVNISKNDLRSKTIEFTDVFLSVKNAIYININKKKFKKLDELKYHTIAMPKDFYAQKFLEEKYPSIKQILVDDQLSALKLLSEGKVDATVGKKVVLDYIIQKNAINNVASTEYLREEKIISHMRIGSSKEDKILINILKKAQQQITREEKNKLNFKWLGLNEFNNNNNNNNNNVFSDKINEYIKKKKKLSLCVNSNNLPIERLDENIYEGISSDYIKIFEEKINLPINLISTKSYIESLSKLTTNECDIATSLPKLMSNEKYINYIYPYIDAQILIASKIDNVYIDNLATYIDKVFVIKDEFIYNIVKNKYPNIKLLKTNTVVEALDLVHQEKAFAYLGDSLSLSYTIQKNYLGIISISGKLEESISYSISIRNNDKILEELIKTITSKIYTSDKIDIESKWLKFKENILIDYSLVIKVIIAFILIIVILFFYQKQKKLKSKIELLNKKLKIKVKKEIEINKQKDETIFKQAKLISMGEMVNNIA
ncbi:MAG: transporter substrate-binding domain-containing protein, partial [Poseidonibacter sp.]|uniref:transporter substrate-binding domain-containing protein n=1 Tax=Poseidonibacter sp. TaxID=2321188 RepID=UPI00359D2EC1